MQQKETHHKKDDNTTWMLLFAGGVGTAFFLLFTDIGREFLENIGVLGVVDSPLPPPIATTDYTQNPKLLPLLLTEQPYTEDGPPSYEPPNPITEWFDKLFRGVKE